MTDRDRAIESIERALEVSAVLRRQLVANERTGRKMIGALRRHVPISECVDASGASAAGVRRSTNDVLAEYAQARHQMRAAFLLPAIGEGMSIAAISRKLGVSRQLASRLVLEAKSVPTVVAG